MRKILLMSLIFATTSSQAFGFANAKATILQNAAMKACDVQVKQVAEELKEKTRKTCDCTVENTDFEALAKNKKNGNTKKIKEDALKIAQECSTHMT